MYRKKAKKRELTPLSVESLREPSPVENRVRIRRDIIDELDVIKIRIDQILQTFEEESSSMSQLYMPSDTAASIPVKVREYMLDKNYLESLKLQKTLENLFKQHEALGAKRERELSSVRDFFRKCLDRFFDEARTAELYFDTTEHHIPDINEFVSAVQNALQMVHQLKILNAQLVEKMSDALKRKDLLSQFEKAGNSGTHSNNQILTMYTNEAVKCGRLEKAITVMTNELESLKTHNSYLMQRNEIDKSKLSEVEISNRELKVTVQKLRTEINSLKHKAARDAAISQQQITYQADSIHAASRLFNPADENECKQTPPQAEVAPHNQTITTSQQSEQKIPSGAVSKKQTSAKHTSRLVEQQLNTMEELLIQGQKRMNLVEKEITDLTNMTNENMNHKYREQYNCLCEAVDMMIILLGRDGSDKLIRSLHYATPSNICGDKKQPIPIKDLADTMKSAVSRVMLELKLFIKLKRKLAASLNRKTLLSSDKTNKSINELQIWLDKELKGIDEEIEGFAQRYEQHKKEIEATQVVHFDQLSVKVDGTIQQLSKSMEKLEMPDNIEEMLRNLTTTANQLNDNPAPNNHPHTNPFGMETMKESKVAVRENISWLKKLSIPAIDVVRRNVAGHLRTKHGVNINSTSWRAQVYKKKAERPLQNYQENPLNKKFKMPSLAHCVDFSANTNIRPPLKSPPEAIRFPTIQKKQPRRLSEILQQTMHPYATRRTAATANATRIFASKATQRQQRTTHILPQVGNTVKFTGTKLERQWQ